jgi:hypothetical protein
MRTFIIVLFLITPFFLQGQAQSLYMPRNVKLAFKNGTRTLDGEPGARYWENHSNYTIDLSVAPPDRMVKGSEQITYFNDSPDTLKSVVFRLTMNYHKPEAGRAGGHGSNLDSSQLTSGIHIDHFAVKGKTIPWPKLADDYTWQNVPLPDPLLPGDSASFSVTWHYEIAPEFAGAAQPLREGMVDPTTWCIAYFYPCVAVYDDYNGWDRLPFTGAQEFYNDFSDYTVKVHVPANFLVWATGTLQNPQAVLQPPYAQLLKSSMTSDTIVPIARPADLEGENITRQNRINTWIWKAKDVTEFALFISNHDDWDATSLVVDSVTGRRASVQAAYYDTSREFHQAAAIGKKALGAYSRHLPGVPYPYPKMTVVEGFAGMEYPMMANDGPGRNFARTREIEHHEIAHTYFPFYTGINESRYAFMDEGWAVTLELLMDKLTSGYAPFPWDVLKIMMNDPSQEDQVPLIASDFQTGRPYLYNGYLKPALAYLALRDLLGDRLFKKCLQGYIGRWHGKHPIPWDFFDAFNDISKRKLNWFWDSWFFSHGYDDVGVGDVIKTGTGYAVTINNSGGFDVPFDINITYGDGSSDTLHETPAVWENNPERTAVAIKTKKAIRSLAIDTGIWTDADEKDNTWTAGP